MPRRSRIRERPFWPGCFGWHHHHFWGPYPAPPPWWAEKPSPEEEMDDLKEHIEMLKEELAAAEDHLKKLGKGK